MDCRPLAADSASFRDGCLQPQQPGPGQRRPAPSFQRLPVHHRPANPNWPIRPARCMAAAGLGTVARLRPGRCWMDPGDDIDRWHHACIEAQLTSVLRQHTVRRTRGHACRRRPAATAGGCPETRGSPAARSAAEECITSCAQRPATRPHRRDARGRSVSLPWPPGPLPW